MNGLGAPVGHYAGTPYGTPPGMNFNIPGIGQVPQLGMFLQQILPQFAGNLGVAGFNFGGQHPMFDTFQSQQFFLNSQVAQQMTMNEGAGREMRMKFMRGMGRMFGSEVDDATLGRLADKTGAMAPFLSQSAPGLWDSFHGWRGDPL